MTLVYGKSVSPNLAAVAGLFLDPLVFIVARFAQRLQLAQSEQIPIAMVGLDVVDHGRRLDQGTLEAHGAQRFAK